MKNLVLKTTALVIVFSFLLCGCANKKADVSYISDVKETNSLLVVSEKTDASETEDATSDEDAIGETEPAWLGQYFTCSGSEALDTFVEWTKNSKIEEETEYNYEFLSWAKQKGELLVPKIKNKVYKLSNCSIDPDKNSYTVVYFAGHDYKPESECTLMIAICPLNDSADDVESLQQLLEKFRYPNSKETTDKFVYNSKCIVQGNYNIEEFYTTTHYVGAQAAYKVPGYFVRMLVYGEKDFKYTWKDEYWDLFEFETVSLK